MKFGGLRLYAAWLINYVRDQSIMVSGLRCHSMQMYSNEILVWRYNVYEIVRQSKLTDEFVWLDPDSAVTVLVGQQEGHMTYKNEL